ncbi:MAG: hypothetical protein PVJ80_02305 [Gemmatimonadota bacterium]|jgi:hypothetical protein
MGRFRGAGSAMVLCAAAGLWAPAVAQQTPSMPSTLRYGSGLLDIPVSSVLSHLEVQGTLSGFFVGLDRRIQVDASGAPTGYGPAVDEFYSDGSLAVGLFDRIETGLSFQQFGGDSDGGDIWGLFGRVRIWEPIDQGVGLAAGARYVTSPDFGDGRSYEPGRLGFADDRFTDELIGGSNLTMYGVATAYVRGFDAGGRIPKNDMTFTLGYGGGMFREGGRLGFYGPGHANGWFYGTSVHLETSERSVVSLMAEHNGFDVNVGVQLDWDGLRVGAHWLASNHGAPSGGYASEYRKPKLGLLASIRICPTRSGLRCRPHLMRRTEPDTIYIPPPPPDTVVINAGPPPAPEGEPITLCLSTGRNVEVTVNAAGDTLVAPGVTVESLRPTLEFSGDYAGGAFWYEDGDPIIFETRRYGRSQDEFPIDCNQILRVGVYEGVPVYADRAAERPLSVIFIPARPGVWRRYERGLP